jgi:predicted ATPase
MPQPSTDQASQERRSLRCAPLTVLTGSNSSYKSTIIQIMMLQKPLVQVSVGQMTTVRLNSPLASHGSLRDWRWQQEGDLVEVGLDFHWLNGKESSLRIELEPADTTRGDARLRALQWRVSQKHTESKAEYEWSAKLPSGEKTAAQWLR